MTTIAISLDKTLLDRIETRAAELKLSLRALLEIAAKEWLDSHPRESWADPLDAQERAVMRSMRGKYRDTLKDPW